MSDSYSIDDFLRQFGTDEPEKKSITQESFEEEGEPDRIYIDLLFSSFLIASCNEDFLADMDFIIRDFLQHYTADELNGFFSDSTEFILIFAEVFFRDKSILFYHGVISAMLNAMRQGDAYAIGLLRYIFKTFFRPLYNRLKRFSVITTSELAFLSDDSSLRSGYVYADVGDVCFYLIMCEAFCIPVLGELDVICRNAREKFLLKYGSGFCQDELRFEEGKLCLKDSIKQVANYPSFSNSDRFSGTERFLRLVTNHTELPMSFLNPRFELNNDDLDFQLAETIAMLRLSFPDLRFPEDFPESLLIPYLFLYRTCIYFSSFASFQGDLLLNVTGLTSFDERPIKYAPEKVLPVEAKGAASSNNMHRPTENEKAGVSKNAIASYEAELSELRRRLREKESDCRYLTERCHKQREKIEELESCVSSLSQEREELIALRNYVYNSALDESFAGSSECEDDELEKMKKALLEKHIVIIGGNDNWTKKLRQIFPSWKYVAPDASTVDIDAVRSADKVIFFTNTLGHRNYQKFVSCCRESRIPFGYLHGVNIRKNISDIYDEVFGK